MKPSWIRGAFIAVSVLGVALLAVPYEDVAERCNRPDYKPTPDPVPAPMYEDSHEPPSGDTSPTSFASGSILIHVRAKHSLTPKEVAICVAGRHGQRSDDVAQLLEGPFDDVEVEVGLDRFFEITVPTGSEKALLRQYAQDPDVEYAQLSPSGAIGAL